MLLENKNAVIYGATGGIGSAMARAFAAEGATVHLTGRDQAKLEALADEIRAAGGKAETAVVDALDEKAVDGHADAVAAAGSLDISFNLIAHGHTHGTPMHEMTVDDYLEPVQNAVRTTFITMRAAARHMTRQGSGVILAFGGSGDPLRDYYIGGTQVAFDAIESMRRQLSAELGKQGVRVVTLRSSGVTDTIPAGTPGRDDLVAGIDASTMRGRGATQKEVADAAAFAASDRASSMTAATINVSAGSLVD